MVYFGPHEALNEELDSARRRMRWALFGMCIFNPMTLIGWAAIVVVFGAGLYLKFFTDELVGRNLLADYWEVIVEYWWWLVATGLLTWVSRDLGQSYRYHRRFLRSHNEKVGGNVSIVISVIGLLISTTLTVLINWDKISLWLERF